MVDADDSTVAQNGAKLAGIAGLLRVKGATLEDLDNKILATCDEEDVDTEATETTDYQTEIFTCLAQIETGLSRCRLGPPDVTVRSRNSSRCSSPERHDSPSAPSSRNHLRLPKLNMETYDGNPLSYRSFMDSFESSVDSDTRLSDIDKFLYLRGLLRGKALSTIAGLKLTSENYGEAKELLRARFGDEKILKATFFGEILNLKPVTDASNVDRLRKLYDTIESSVRNLKSLGVLSENFAAAIIPTILSKIPDTIRLEVSKLTRGVDWDYDHVLEVINNELVAREQCLFMTGTEGERPSRGDRGSRDRERRGSDRIVTSGASLHGGLTKKDRPYKQSKCVYCGDSHKSLECDRVTDVDSRRDILRTEKRCYNCLKKGCRVSECKSPYTCRHCQQKHHSSIHPIETNTEEEPKTEDAKGDGSFGGFGGNGEVVLLKTAVAHVSNSNDGTNSTNARLILDDGSQRSYVQRALKEKLNLKPIPVDAEDVIVKGICGRSTIMKSEMVELFVRTDSGTWIKIIAGVLDEICEPINQPSTRCAVRKYPHLKNITFADYHNGKDVEIQILIGGDYYYDLVASGKTSRGPRGTPTAVHTEVGWTLGGPVTDDTRSSTHTNLSSISSLFGTTKSNTSQIIEDKNEDDFLQRFWDLDTVGIREDEKPVSEKFLDDIRFDPQKPEYEVRLPRKPNISDLPSNYNNAFKRLHSEFNKLKRNSDPDALRNYHEIIMGQLETGKIERCTDQPTKDVHYLPHRGVWKENRETTKLRIVYDASSKTKGALSLNECLYKGPSLTPHLFDVLLVFRLFPIAFTCDIQKAFLQIRVAEHDRNFLRFLWFEDPFAPDPVVIILRFAYVLFGLNCSPFLLNGTLRHHLIKYDHTYHYEISKIIRLLYVDDFPGGAITGGLAGRLFNLFKRVLREGGFTVHKIFTNDPQLRNEICPNTENDPTPTIVKVLGISWNIESDTLHITFENDFIEHTVTVTKRTIAQTVMKVFDPLGLISPVVLAAKLMLQEAWIAKSDWDSPLNDDLQTRWKTWCEGLVETGGYEFPRCYIRGDGEVCHYQLIGFSDASTKAYAAVVYLRAIYRAGTASSVLVASKTRVAPTKISTKTASDDSATVPRLELLSCYILTTLMQTIVRALGNDINITKQIFWTDSTISLHRIRNTNTEYKPFVENRLHHCRKNSDVSNWFYVPTEINPADLPSRGCMPGELADNQLWLHGPSFLQDASFDDFEMFERNLQPSARVEDPEQKKSSVPIEENVFVAVSKTTHPKLALHELIKLEKFNDLSHLLRVTSYCLRFVSREKTEFSEELQSNEIENARKLWLISEQFRYSQSNKEEFEKTKANLKIYVDEQGVMRCRGRLGNSELPYDTKYPVYVPHQSRLAVLLILEAHENVFHQKERPTLTEVRTNYWIPKCRRLIRSLLPKCWLCNRLESLAFTLPSAPPLPNYRVEISPPFSNVGYDHMGPLWVYDIYGKDKVAHKAYVSLITCCTTRMMHLELQPSLEAPVCIRGLKRTFGRVGYPKRIVSDNHKTFKSSLLRQFAAKNSITWKYILELSPHWGGFYERLNRMIKSALRKILWKSKLTYEEVETILIGIEGVLNCRPLCYVDDSDISEPLTPSHLMYGRNLQRKAILHDEPKSDELPPSARVKHVRKLQKHFWKRFSSEYVTALRERDAQKRKGSERVCNLKVGDVVMIHQKQVARASWPLGRVARLIESNGKTRGVELTTESGTLNRAINKLHPLEMSS